MALYFSLRDMPTGKSGNNYLPLEPNQFPYAWDIAVYSTHHLIHFPGKIKTQICGSKDLDKIRASDGSRNPLLSPTSKEPKPQGSQEVSMNYHS